MLPAAAACGPVSCRIVSCCVRCPSHVECPISTLSGVCRGRAARCALRATVASLPYLAERGDRRYLGERLRQDAQSCVPNLRAAAAPSQRLSERASAQHCTGRGTEDPPPQRTGGARRSMSGFICFAWNVRFPSPMFHTCRVSEAPVGYCCRSAQRSHACAGHHRRSCHCVCTGERR